MDQEKIRNRAKKNYSQSKPWPDDDAWHLYTSLKLTETVEKWLKDHTNSDMVILNAGSGGKEYDIHGKMIHLDMIEEYVCGFENHIVSDVWNTTLPDESVDGIICVGSVLNYADAQRTVSEFSRILKTHGFLILEFERSDSAEFWWTGLHCRNVFPKEYDYNNQSHLLWMYGEKHMRQTLKHYGFDIVKCRRLQSLSSVMYRLGLPENKAVRYAVLDNVLQPFSCFMAHNAVLFCMK